MYYIYSCKNLEKYIKYILKEKSSLKWLIILINSELMFWLIMNYYSLLIIIS